MIKKIGIVFFFILASIKLESQPPSLDYTHVWTEFYLSFGSSYWYIQYSLDSIPTIINDNTYFEVLYSHNSEPWLGNGHFFRFEDNRVYLTFQTWDSEAIIYDFNLSVNDTFSYNGLNGLGDFEVVHIDTIFLENGEPRKRLELECPGGGFYPIYWIEGIGATNGIVPLSSFCVTDFYSSVLCLTRNDTILYLDPDYSTCWHLSVDTYEFEKENISFYPSPAFDRITISDPDQNIRSISIIDFLGHVWISGKDLEIELVDLPSGSYIIVFDQKDGHRNSNKFIKI